MKLFDYFPVISRSIVFGTIFIAIAGALSVGVVFGLVCRTVLRNKGYPPQLNHGFLWGFFLGLIGLVVCLLKQPYFDGQSNMYGRGNFGNAYGQPFGIQPGSSDWYCSCGAPNPPDSRICLFCGNTRGH